MALRIRKSITFGAGVAGGGAVRAWRTHLRLANGSDGREDLEEVYEPDPGSREAARLLGRDPSPEVSSG